MNRTYFSCDGLNFMKKAVKSLFSQHLPVTWFSILRQCSGTFGINKGKRTVVTHFAYHVHGLLKIFLRLTRESDNDIRCQRDIRYCGTDLIYQSK
mgnify:CR=1 FL=1